MKASKIALLLGLSIVVASHAEIIGETSTPTDSQHYMTVGASNVYIPTIHHTGKAGFGVSHPFLWTSWGANMRVDFGGVAHSGSTKTTPVDGVTVYQNNNGNGDEEHSKIGGLTFVQVADADVWYGEWKNVTKEGKPVRQVYYVGDDTGTTIPTSGSATYTVHGLNHFNGSNVLHGEFTANFGTQKLTGSIQNDNLMIDMFSVGFNNAGEISGIAFARNPQTHKFLARTVSNSDKVKGLTGHFFGANAASLAGFAQFDDQHRDYDTAFGGTKK